MTTPGSPLIINYALERRNIVASGFVLQETVTPPFSFFDFHGYIQHAWVGCINSYSLRYHMYLIQDDIKIKDSVLYTYRGRFNKIPELTPPLAILEEVKLAILRKVMTELKYHHTQTVPPCFFN